MGRIRTDHDRYAWRGTDFRKKSIPCRVRLAVAVRHGCPPGHCISAKCHYCEFLGQIVWHVDQNGSPTRWVTFPDLELDHVIPEFLGGEATEENIVLACRRCNRSKGTRKAPRGM